jgi:hypothetical protein
MAAVDFDAPNGWLRRFGSSPATLAFALVAGCDASVVSVGAWQQPEDAPSSMTMPDASREASREASLEAASDDVVNDASSVDGSLEETGTPDVVIGEESTGIYLEAESGQLSGGYTIGNDTTASAGQFISPPVGPSSITEPGTARAVYSFEVTTPGRYIIWARLQAPGPLHNVSWFQVDGGTWYLSRISTGDIWYWFHVHDNINYYVPLTFNLAAGVHQFTMAKGEDGQRIDRFYVTASGDMPPQTTTPCTPPNSIGMGAGCSPSCGSLGGMTCGTTNCMGRQLVMRVVYDCPVCCY